MNAVLFTVNGSYNQTCLGIRCLKQALKKEQITSIILEKNLRDRSDYILEELYAIAKDASFLSFSCYIWNIELLLELAENIHKLLPCLPIVFGGPEVSYDTDRFVNKPFITSIICGEGEDSICTFAKALKNEEKPQKIYFAQKNYEDFTTQGILYEQEDLPHGSIIYYESSRGCPYSCAYCLSSVEEGHRFKTIKKTLEDLQSFEALQDIKIIKFVDRTFNFPEDRANAIWRELLKDCYTKHYHFEVCANLLNEESFSILKQFPKGKIQLEFGLQSTNEETLQTIARHINPHLILNNVRRIHDFGNIHVHLDLIAGLPYETYHRFAKSFDEAWGASDMLQLGFLKLLHGTKLQKDASQYNYTYLPKAPYTILSNKWISYEELVRLHRIDELLERYFETGHFKKSLNYVLSLQPSPFKFFESFSYDLEKRNRRLQQISQNDAFLYLYEFVSTLVNKEELDKFITYMHEDYQEHEVRRVPSFLLKEIK